MSEFSKKLVINQAQTDIGFLDEIGIFTHISTKKLAQEVIDRWNSHDALLEACEEGHKRISFLLNKIIKAEAFSEFVILERVEIDKTESCINYVKAVIAETEKK